MKEILVLGLAALVAVGSIFLITSSQATQTQVQEQVSKVDDLLSFEGAPEGFMPPPLHPRDIQLQLQPLAPDVYAIVSGHPAVDNTGFIVGDRGVLVIDSHINAAMANQMQELIRSVTDKPILYLVNTNFHGDHTFGNDAFPETTTIISHRNTYKRMTHFEHEKEFMLATVDFDESVFGDANLRLPDVVFDEYAAIDLGNRTVEIYHFGHGNTPGDAVVYDPQSRTAWTGNFIVGEGTIPPLFEGGAEAYLESVNKFRDTLPIRTIVPGHGLLSGPSIFDFYETYLTNLVKDVRKAVRSGWSLEKTLERITVELAAPEGVDEETLMQIVALMTGFHRLNVQLTYLELRN